MTEESRWELRQTYSARTLAVVFVAFLLLVWSGRRTEMDRAIGETIEGVGQGLGLVEDAPVARGFGRFVDSAFPLVIEERRETGRIPDLDRDDLPAFSYLETVDEQEYNAETGAMEVVGKAEYLVQRFGYLSLIAGKMLETLEIAIWGTLLALLIAAPLGFFATRQFSGNRVCYAVARALCSFNRAVPELISAMFFVLMYGFGAIPGVLALGIHASGFLGKFFADDFENADRGPQNALSSTGAGRLLVLRYAVLPQVMPQILAYLQYILERNFRTATVLGLVGAGGIGMELKGRWDMSDFGHVSTILLVIFITVVILEQITQRVRARLIR